MIFCGDININIFSFQYNMWCIQYKNRIHQSDGYMANTSRMVGLQPEGGGHILRGTRGTFISYKKCMCAGYDTPEITWKGSFVLLVFFEYDIFIVYCYTVFTVYTVQYDIFIVYCYIVFTLYTEQYDIFIVYCYIVFTVYTVHHIDYLVQYKNVRQGKSIAVVYTLRAYWNPLALGWICKQ